MKADVPAALFSADSRALIKKHLPPDLFRAMAEKATSSGFTIEQAIQSGIQNPDSSIGFYAGDKETYCLFARVLIPLIREYHGLKQHQGHQDGWESPVLPPLDPDCRHIRSTRIRVARNLAPYPFPPHMTAHDRCTVETEFLRATETLSPGLKGHYTRFSDVSDQTYREMRRQKLAFPKGDRFMEAAGINRDFPLARGVFLSQDQDHTFRVWVNEEDHLRVISMSRGDNLQGVYETLVQGLTCLEKALEFSYDPMLGFLCACPTNIGTAMRAGVHIHLPGLEKDQARLKKIARAHHLQIRGTGGEKTAVSQAVFDISNARRLGVSAGRIIQDLHAGVSAILEAEKRS